MIGESPECFGRKHCPRGKSTFAHAFCDYYDSCGWEFGIRILKRTNSIVKTLEALRAHFNSSDGYGIPDERFLKQIAGMMKELGLKFGRKKVDRAIKLSNIHESAVAKEEIREIREAFGVYGREQTSPEKTCAIGRISESSKSVSAQTQAPLNDLSYETKRPAEAKLDSDFHPIETQDKKGGFS